MKYFPLHDRVLVKTDKHEEKTKGGIFLPETYTDERINKPNTGVIVAVGKGMNNSKGEFVPTTVKVGERIVFDSTAGAELKELGEGLKVISEKDVLAVISEE